MTGGIDGEDGPGDRGRQAGGGWFVTRGDGSRDYFSEEEPVVAPRVDRTQPKRIRFFSDDCTGIALWPDEQLDLETSSGWPGDGASEHLEDDLPISPSLRARIRAWVDEVTAEIEAGTPIADRLEHDRRGHALSVELQDALGPEYEVTYLFETREVRDALGG